jgi:hypothetical protein
MENDPTETKNVSSLYPDKVKKMSAVWEKEANRTMAKPWPWESKKVIKNNQ